MDHKPITMDIKAYLSLSPVSQVKVEYIYRIALILKYARLPKLTVCEFDGFYDMEPEVLYKNMKDMEQYYLQGRPHHISQIYTGG